MESTLRLSLPTMDQLKAVFERKYRHGSELGWAPKRRLNHGYFLPTDYYEATIEKHIEPGNRWLDVGGGRAIFPQNGQLAQELVDRCEHVVAVDPSDNVLDNPFVHERHRMLLENYETDQTFDLVTMRMVAEHVANPTAFVSALSRLLKPGGRAIVFTVNLYSPVTVVSRFTPFGLHYRLKSLFWKGEERDTFPTAYRMNRQSDLAQYFSEHGFAEEAFTRIDDLSVFRTRKRLGAMELKLWQMCKRLRISYPENCLLGIYRKQG